jgi:hypothetical protein
MRISSTVSWALVAVVSVVSVVLWRELRAERQLVTDLRTELGEAKAALMAVPAPQPVPVAAVPETAAAVPVDAPAAPTDKAAAVREASAVVLTESAQRQNALLDDPEFRKARLTQARVNLRLKWPNLARDLGLTDAEAEALFNTLAEDQLRQETELASYMAKGAPANETLAAEFTRLQNEHKQQQKETLVALLGPGRYADFEDYEQTTPSRDRVNNISNLMAQAGTPLTATQAKSFTALMVGEQRRRLQMQAQPQAAGGPSSAELLIESDQRVLEAAGGFLDPKQVELLKGRFDQMAAQQRAMATMQQRAIEAQSAPTADR